MKFHLKEPFCLGDCLHVPCLYPCPSKSPSKFNIVPMVMDRLTNRLDLEPILFIRACLHIPSLSPCSSQSPSKFNIVPMEMDSLADRLGLEPILTVEPSLCTQCKFDRDADGHRYGDGKGDGTLAVMLMETVMIRVNGTLGV